MKKVLLLDIENQSKKLRELTILLEQYHQVILVYATSNLVIALDDLMIFSQAIQEQRLLVIKMPKAGANSADFGLTFIAGRLSATLEQGSCVDVMSNDKEMSYAVELLSQVGIQSIQLKQLIESPKNPEPILVTQEKIVNQQESIPLVTQDITRVLEILVKNKPKKQKSLKKSLVVWCQIDKGKANIMIQTLQRMSCIMIKEDKIKYNEQTIQSVLLQSCKKIDISPIADEMTMAYISVRPHLMRVKQYCNYLEKIKNNKPTKQSGLENSLKSVLKLEQDAPVKNMINLLKKHKIIQIDGQKIIYQVDSIMQWASIK
ncbi:MAG: hypothetical protein E6Q25_09055 [Acinetobacter sp.]|nr:MAG: hypothetical protein E6Q25_09055 [Acinetobacter sp.]